jgi:ferredoxin
MIPIIEQDKCTGCGECEAVCPSQAIYIRNKMAYIKRELCEECGECAKNCKEGAITIPKG